MFLAAHLIGGVGQAPTQGKGPRDVRESAPDHPFPSATEERSNLSSWREGIPIAIRVDRGRALFRAPMPKPGSGVLLIVSSLARKPGPFPIELRVREAKTTEPSEGQRVNAIVRASAPSIELADPGIVRPEVSSTPPSSRTFHLMVRNGDYASHRNYEAVSARLRAFGKRIQVYVAEDDVTSVAPEVLKDIVDTFDARIFPQAAKSLGVARDIDADGRFTVLLTSWLARMGHGDHAVDGFVRVADLDSAYSAPFGNQCDMMYLSTELQAGPHLRTVIAHEYTHAVTFSQKSLKAETRPAHGVDGIRVEEEGWMDEALAHLAEDLHGFSRSNLDYRVSAFLSAPDRYRLIVDDYYAANLFRSHGNRGSTYLFLRWCVDTFGSGLVTELIRSDKSGVANLEAATGCRFSDLYRAWSLALAATAFGSDIIHDEGNVPNFRSIELSGTTQGYCLAGPRIDHIDPRSTGETWNATGTSSRYLVIEKREGEAVEIEITATESTELQVTAVPLPSDLPQLQVNLRASHDSSGDLNVRIATQSRVGESIRLTGVGWEPLVPTANPKRKLHGLGSMDMRAINSRFGAPTILDGRSSQSLSLKLQGIQRTSGPYVLKLVGVDEKGRNITKWFDLNTPTRPIESEFQDDLEVADDLSTDTVFK